MIGLRIMVGITDVKRASYLPKRPADRHCHRDVCKDLRSVRRVGDFRNNTFNDANVAVKDSIETSPGTCHDMWMRWVMSRDGYEPQSSAPISS